MENKCTKRGQVYEFLDRSEESMRRYAVIVSNENRCMSKIINILLTGLSPVGDDVVPVVINDKQKFLHCGCVTYCRKEKIGEYVGELDAETMEVIDCALKEALGLVTTEKYEKLLAEYNNILEKALA